MIYLLVGLEEGEGSSKANSHYFSMFMADPGRVYIDIKHVVVASTHLKLLYCISYRLQPYSIQT